MELTKEEKREKHLKHLGAHTIYVEVEVKDQDNPTHLDGEMMETIMRSLRWRRLLRRRKEFKYGNHYDLQNQMSIRYLVCRIQEAQ